MKGRLVALAGWRTMTAASGSGDVGGPSQARPDQPGWLDPELATLTQDRFSDPAWIFEASSTGSDTWRSSPDNKSG